VVMADALAVLRASGCRVVDPADIPSVSDPQPSRKFHRMDLCAGARNIRGHDRTVSIVLKIRHDTHYNTWLDRSTAAPSGR